MKNLKYPKISIVLPVYNEEDKIEACLKSIRSQDYDQKKIEIVFVDDDSTDKSLEIAKKFNIVLVKNGKHDYDIGKSLGIQKAKGEYIMFLDADNILTSKDWIKKIITPLLENKNIVGSQPLWFKHNPEDSIMDRYGSLFGITDPLTIYLNKRDRLMLWEKKWAGKSNAKTIEKKHYFITRFNKKNLPTIGSVGFTIKKEYLLKTNCKPAFSHLDCMQDLVKQGKNTFALVKLDVIHLHSSSYSSFIGKLKRNFNIFARDYRKRRYVWQAPFTRKVAASLMMLTLIYPLYHSIRGYKEIRDWVWFLHPFICLNVIIIYLRTFFLWKISSFLKSLF
jgi:glycosyltransferase involved in cell wall biosynthesis